MLKREYRRKFCIADHEQWIHHRSGWRYCVRAVERNLSIPNGVAFHPNQISLFIYGDKASTSAWTGFLHFSPSCFARYADYFSRDHWKRNQEKCLGIYVLSERAAEVARSYVEVPVCVVYFAAEKTDSVFSMDKFWCNKSKKVLFIGHWLRRVESIYKLSTCFDKVLLNCTNVVHQNTDDVTVVPYVNEEEYDRLLEDNIVFVDLEDASANNVVIECMVRNTPLLIRDLPAVREYLGDDYPFYFGDLEEASHKLSNTGLVEATHEYLTKLSKDKIDIHNFVHAIATSSIYESIVT